MVLHYVEWLLALKAAEEILLFVPKNLFFFWDLTSLTVSVLPWSRVCSTKYVCLALGTCVVLFLSVDLAICEGSLLTFH